MNENYERENTGEITCPHCDYEFSESYECIPAGDGELCWEEKCPECKKEFDVSFDARNIDDGFTSRIKKCEEGSHKYELRDPIYKSTYSSDREISNYSKIHVCTVCNHYRFTPVKEDGSDFTKEEFLDFKRKRKLKNRSKIYNIFEGKKTGNFEIIKNSEIILRLNEEDGNVRLWASVCRWFKSKGYMQRKLPDYLRDLSVEFKKGWLECTVSVSRGSISIVFYQNEIFKNRKAGDGRYEHDKYEILTPQMQLRMRASIMSVKKMLIGMGFVFIKKKTDTERLMETLGVKNLKDWKDPVNHMKNDYEDANKKIMKSGDTKYFYYQKVLMKGTVYWDNGNQWFALVNGSLYRKAHWDFFDYNGEPKRKPLTRDEQVQRLHTELSRNEKNHNYLKCKVLWDKLQMYRLYNVWSIKHNAWWGKNNCGYTSDKSLAGVYTHENIMSRQSYYNDGVDSKAIEIK